MGMHKIDDNLDAPSMSLIDKFFELIRFAEPAGNTEEIADMVAEGTIIWVLQDGHQLDHVVALGFDNGQHNVFEMFVSVDLRWDTAHPDVALVDADVLVRPFGLWVFPFIVVQCHVDPVIGFVLVLMGEIDPGWDPILGFPVFQLYLHFDPRELFNRCLRSEFALPMPVLPLH